MLVIGIDPGVTTGFAVWSPTARAFELVESMRLHKALQFVIELVNVQAVLREHDLLVVFEDCRSHRVFGSGQQHRTQAVLQGVGSVKRDCGIWDEFLTDRRIPFITRRPSAKRTKLNAVQFQAATGWTGKSNNHGRDAAMLVHGIAESVARAWLNEAKQRVSCAR